MRRSRDANQEEIEARSTNDVQWNTGKLRPDQHPARTHSRQRAKPTVRGQLPQAESRLTVVHNNENNTDSYIPQSGIPQSGIPQSGIPQSGIPQSGIPQSGVGKEMLTNTFAGNKVVILGLARQGSALARFFASLGAKVVVSDIATADKLQDEITALSDLPIEFALGSHPLSLLDDCALLCLSGGVPPQHPLVQAALTKNIPLSNDSLLTFQLAQGMGLGPLIGITGSSGKTTTTTLVGKILDEQGITNHVGGNIGTPLIDRMQSIHPKEPLILELSSFQLELFDSTIAWGPLERLGPQIATITNLTPNHLDRHSGMAAYAEAKLNLLRQMGPGSTLIVNVDDPVTSRLAPPVPSVKRRKLPAEWKLEDMLAETRAALEEQGVQIIPVSRQVELEQGAWLADNILMLHGQPICMRDQVQLRGDHNISNILTASAIAHAAGAEMAAISKVARDFHGVAHRLEIVSEMAGVTWINDSIATSPERAIAAMRSFDPAKQTIILLAGGKDKNLPWDAFASEAIGHVSFLIGFGQSGPMIVRQVQERARFMQHKAPNCAVVQRLDEAVELAARVAGKNSVILLSPGGTSFDAYRDFEERGEHFRQLVHRTVQQRTTSETHVGSNTAT